MVGMGDYRAVVFADTADMTDPVDVVVGASWLITFPGACIRVARRPFANWESAEILCVSHTLVTMNTLVKCPKLRWVFVRAHSIANVDLDACRMRGVGVASVGPYAVHCARYLSSYIDDSPVLFYGYGRIMKQLEIMCGSMPHGVVSRQTPLGIVQSRIQESRVIVAAIPSSPSRPVFGPWFFRHCAGVRFVSICRGELIDNTALREAVVAGRVRDAVMDSLSINGRTELLATGRVKYTEHTAWRTGFNPVAHRLFIRIALDSLGTSAFPGVVHLVPRV